MPRLKIIGTAATVFSKKGVRIRLNPGFLPLIHGPLVHGAISTRSYGVVPLCFKKGGVVPPHSKCGFRRRGNNWTRIYGDLYSTAIESTLLAIKRTLPSFLLALMVFTLSACSSLLPPGGTERRVPRLLVFSPYSSLASSHSSHSSTSFTSPASPASPANRVNTISASSITSATYSSFSGRVNTISGGRVNTISDGSTTASHDYHDYHSYLPYVTAGDPHEERERISPIAEQLAKGLRLYEARETPLIVLPVQELAEQNAISSFGLYWAEQLKTELYLKDFHIFCPGQSVERELLRQIARNQGRFLPLQENPLVKRLFLSGVRSIVYGSYRVGSNSIYLNVKMVSLESLEIISAGICELPKDSDTLDLISRKRFLSIVEGNASSAPDPEFSDHEDEKKQRGTDRRSFGFTVKGEDDFYK
jgi:hypothetical protein